MNLKNIKFLSGNELKIIASLSMLIDHIGIIFFPKIYIFRIIGRLSFPIFSFMIAEGCRYTKNKTRYFFTIFLFATFIQVIYYLYSKDLYMCVLVTFSISILIIYALQNFKNSIYSSSSFMIKLFSGILFFSTLIITYLLNKYLDIDYGFCGCMLPVLVSLFHSPKDNTSKLFITLDQLPIHICVMGIGLILLSIGNEWFQIFSLLSLPLLLMYSGCREKINLKYFFYIFYPLHIVILEFVHMLIN